VPELPGIEAINRLPTVVEPQGRRGSTATERGLAADHVNLEEGRNHPYAGQRIAGSFGAGCRMERRGDIVIRITTLLRRSIASRNRGRRPDSRITEK
jgi:hypothetical protein